MAVTGFRPMSFVRHYLLALQFFTRIPVTGRLAQWVGFSPAMLRASAAHFPGVGWLVGIMRVRWELCGSGLALQHPSTPATASRSNRIACKT